MTQKFVMGSPLYRQEQELKRQGIPLSRQTMSNWILKASEIYLEPVYEQLHKELLKQEVLHADETTLQVLHEPGKEPQSKSYMWLYRTGGDTDQPIVMYEYQPSRGATHPKEFLVGFKGYLHTDGYAGYHNLPEDITVVGCWAHLRRKFDEAMKSLPKGKAKNSSAAQGLSYCTLLFELEDDFTELTPEERYKQRLEQEKPVLDAFLAWANVRNAAPKSALGKALTYLKEQWPYLTNYLKDGRLELSNNRAERSMKPFVIDRKNFLFANTPGGAKGSAVIFTMIQTAIENHLDPFHYLTWLLKTANNADLKDLEIIQRLLPWNAPPECRTK
ncbi:transposase IS66 [gut metagenome]|uniref:Transposase IS66 n=1 Tax=gut metagenome TaxID=749906 RepID=J9GR91_9ZZZZ